MVDKLFWVFDEDGDGTVDHKELAIGLVMLKENTFKDKLDKFFDICDEDNSGTIDKKEFYNLLKMSLIDYEDRSSLRAFVNEIFQAADIDGNGELTKKELYNACSKDERIKKLIEKNLKLLKEVDHWIDSDLQKPFHTRITFSLGCTSSKSKAIYYPFINKLLSTLEEREEIFQKYDKIQRENREKFQVLKEKLNKQDVPDIYQYTKS